MGDLEFQGMWAEILSKLSKVKENGDGETKLKREERLPLSGMHTHALV
jgi:hypothetical protein